MYITSKKIPPCFYNSCDIQDILSGDDSVELNNIVDAFIATESLDLAQGWATVQEKNREESGLNALDISTILTLKKVWTEWIKFKQQQETNKRGIR